MERGLRTRSSLKEFTSVSYGEGSSIVNSIAAWLLGDQHANNEGTATAYPRDCDSKHNGLPMRETESFGIFGSLCSARYHGIVALAVKLEHVAYSCCQDRHLRTHPWWPLSFLHPVKQLRRPITCPDRSEKNGSSNL